MFLPADARFLFEHVPPFVPAGLLVQQILPSPDHLTIVVAPREPCAACPTCATPSSHVHSRYDRLLRDLPWQGRQVMLRVQARRFRCLAPASPRLTFAERLADTAPPTARRTERLADLQRHLGLVAGGEVGARLTARLAMPTSADTLLRMARRTGAVPRPRPPVRVLAVDEWAWRRGHRHGTVLVDLERNRVVDLLPDRRAESLSAWLQANPGVEVVARDRAGVFADGIRRGAPDAIEAADRWHLLRNLGDAVHAAAQRHHASARRVAGDVMAQPPSAGAPSTAASKQQPAAVGRRPHLLGQGGQHVFGQQACRPAIPSPLVAQRPRARSVVAGRQLFHPARHKGQHLRDLGKGPPLRQQPDRLGVPRLGASRAAR